MSRLVCDTNILVSGFLWHGTPRRILLRVERGEDLLFITRNLLGEVERVLVYDKLQAPMHAAGIASDDLLYWLVEHSTLLLAHPLPSVVITDDPSDDAVLACAAAAGADAIVSGDRHLLGLATFQGIPIYPASGYLAKAGARPH